MKALEGEPRILSESVTQAIKGRRLDLRLSQEELASLSGLHRNTLGKIERGEARPNIIVLTGLLVALGSTGVGIENDGWYPLFVRTTGVDAGAIFRARKPPAVIADIGRAIREARQAQGASQKELSAAAGIHLNSLWSLESGLVAPSSATVHRIYRALGLRLATVDDRGLILA